MRNPHDLDHATRLVEQVRRALQKNDWFPDADWSCGGYVYRFNGDIMRLRPEEGRILVQISPALERSFVQYCFEALAPLVCKIPILIEST